jgi:hypothetical protein
MCLVGLRAEHMPPAINLSDAREAKVQPQGADRSVPLAESRTCTNNCYLGLP